VTGKYCIMKSITIFTFRKILLKMDEEVISDAFDRKTPLKT
jgi:hypothetical protein